jgi:hypothetical protein
LSPRRAHAREISQGTPYIQPPRIFMTAMIQVGNRAGIDISEGEAEALFKGRPGSG